MNPLGTGNREDSLTGNIIYALSASVVSKNGLENLALAF